MSSSKERTKRERDMFYLTTHSTNVIYGYMASDIWLRTILIVRKETCCRHIGYSYRLTARVLLYAPSHKQDNTYHSLCYTSRGELAGTKNSSMGPPHEGSIWRPIAPWANALPLSYVPLPKKRTKKYMEKLKEDEEKYKEEKSKRCTLSKDSTRFKLICSNFIEAYHWLDYDIHNI